MTSVSEYVYNFDEEHRIISGFKTAKTMMKDGIFGGSTAIYYLCIQLGIPVNSKLLHEDSDIDIYYLGNIQRVTSSRIGVWIRKESCPSTHVTYCHKPDMDINIHMLKQASLSYITIGEYNFMTPQNMLEYYEDEIDNEGIEYKISLLHRIKEELAEVETTVHKMYKH